MVAGRRKVLNIELTIPQFFISIAPQKRKFAIMGRGAGKTTIMGKHMRDLVLGMPRASFALVGATYTQLLSRTLPSAIEGLEMFGFYQDVDYVIGRCGKRHGYAMPFQPPQQWNNVIHFANGAIFQLVSLDNPNSGRGLNSYAEVGDEGLMLDPEKLYNNVKTTNRAQKKEFANNPLLGSEFYVSSMPISRKGMWILEMEAKAKKDPQEYFFIMASALSNPYLQKDWFKRMKEQAPSQLMYDTEILNIRPKGVKDGFYANLNPKVHYYEAYNIGAQEGFDLRTLYKHTSLYDNDVDENAPLDFTFDFGVFNSVVVGQENNVGKKLQYRILKSMFVKNPKLLDDLLIEQLIPYYRYHKHKVCYIYGGHDGHNKLPNSSRTLYEQIKHILIQHNWTVIVMAKSSAPTHAEKYLLINSCLKETDPNLPEIRINEHNNPDLIIALERAEAKEGTKGIEKNKSSERNQSLPQEHATHLTDAFDMPIFHRYNDRFTQKSSFFHQLGGIQLG